MGPLIVIQYDWVGLYQIGSISPYKTQTRKDFCTQLIMLALKCLKAAFWSYLQPVVFGRSTHFLPNEVAVAEWFMPSTAFPCEKHAEKNSGIVSI